MKRDYKLYIQDIKDSINKIQEYTKNINEEQFKKDEKLQDAVARRFEIIGEACRNIPRALKEKNNEIPWFKLAQFRDLISHMYHEISLNKVWKAVKDDIPGLKIQFQDIKLI